MITYNRSDVRQRFLQMRQETAVDKHRPVIVKVSVSVYVHDGIDRLDCWFRWSVWCSSNKRHEEYPNFLHPED